jgi:hypothetical protein
MLDNFPDFTVEPVRGQWKKGKLSGRLTPLNTEESIFKLKDIDAFDSTDSSLIKMSFALSGSNISRSLSSILSPGVQASYQLEWSELREKQDDLDAATDFVHDTLSGMIRLMNNKNTYEFLG